MTTQCTVLMRRAAHNPRTLARLEHTHGNPLRKALLLARSESHAAPAATVSVFISMDNETPREVARFVDGEEIEL